MKKTVLAVVAAISLIRVCAGGEQLDAPIDGTSVTNFFNEFVRSFNAKDVERVRKMSGKTWEKWYENMNDNVKLESIAIRNISKDGMIIVTTEASAIDRNGKARLDEVVFTLRICDGNYAIEDMTVPEVEKWNQEFKAADNVVEKLIAAINAQDMDAVKTAFAFGDGPAFETELTSRGLSWITNAVKNQILVPRRGSGVSLGNEYSPLIGRVCVPRSPGGTNVLERFYFKDGKIDRAVPRRETKEESLKRLEAERAAVRKKYEEQHAVEEKRNCNLREAFKTVKELAKAIAAHDMKDIRGLLSIEDAEDLENELSSRGLVWIKEMVDNKVAIPVGGIGASYTENDRLTGWVDAPHVPGGTNVLERFYFKDGKIDRAVEGDL